MTTKRKLDHEIVIDLYKNGMTVREIHEKTSYKMCSIDAIIRRNGINRYKDNEIKYYIDKNGCWICTSHAPNSKGYPMVMKNSKRELVSRYFYKKYKGEILKGLLVRHTCDVTNCINPDHLLQGTVKDNVRDSIERNRRSPQEGERNHNAKIRNKDIEYIRNNKNIKVLELSEKFGVHISTIYNIRSGRKRKN